jgi:LacI family transcriptional regulator
VLAVPFGCSIGLAGGWLRVVIFAQSLDEDVGATYDQANVTVNDYSEDKVVTIREVAKAAGVSTATVSRLLAGQRVKNAEHIQAVIDELGYRTNPVASGLRTGSHHTIGVISPDTSNSLLAEIVQGIQMEARRRGYRVLVGDSDEDAVEEHNLIEDLALRVDGLLVFPINEKANSLQLRDELPLVLVDRDSFAEEPHDLVSVDNEAGARLAVEHLVALGHERIATIAGRLTSFPGRLRQSGFVKAMANAGLPVRDEYVAYGGFRTQGGIFAMEELLALEEPPTAVFVANNAMTIGAYTHLRAAGVSIPDQISLVGFDDFQLAGLLTPGITVVNRPTVEQGRAAAELLFRRIQASAELQTADPVQLNLEVELIVRNSTGPALSGKESQ